MTAPAPRPLRLLARAPGVPGTLAVSGALSLTGLVATALGLVLLARVVEGALLRGQAPTLSTLGLILAALVVRALCGAAREWWAGQRAARAVASWREQLRAAALRLGPVALADTRGGDLATLDADLEGRLTPYYARYLPNAVHAALAFAVMLGFTAWLDAPTAGLLLITAPLTVVFLALVGLAAGAAAEKQYTLHTRLAARLLTLARHLPTLHAYGAVPPYRAVLAESAEAHRGATLRVLRVAFLSGFVMDFAATISTALIAVYIGVRLFGGAAELAPTLAALLLVPELFGPLRQMGTDRHAALDAGPLAGRLNALLARPTAPIGSASVPAGTPHLSFHMARAALDAPLRPLSAEIAPGTHGVLRGPSGSGKTSLLHALGRHVPYAGEIQVGGVALHDLDATWQTRVAHVPQHPRLLAASVADNLRLAAPGADEGALLAALSAVNLLEVIAALPGGLSAPLGEGGTVLSGGETARLALARALLSGADVVLLDEVTAHLDPESEADVLDVIRRAFAGRTVLLASHRPAPAGWRVLDLGPVPAGVAA